MSIDFQNTEMNMAARRQNESKLLWREEISSARRRICAPFLRSIQTAKCASYARAKDPDTVERTLQYSTVQYSTVQYTSSQSIDRDLVVLESSS